MEELSNHFQEWERWSAELLESLLSYPILGFFRSHHDNQSWLGSLTAMLDACSFILASTKGVRNDQAQFTFAMTRHTIIDLAEVYNCPPLSQTPDRLPHSELEHICSLLSSTGLELPKIDILEQNLLGLRQMYEPYVYSISKYLHITLPSWFSETTHRDNWQISPWRLTEGVQEGKYLEHNGHF
jgi:hypothetical protein